MKIGELAQLCGVPQATIRYYVRTGMLVPDDSGSQYNFTDREYQNLQLILKMKRQKFNLKEIQDYLVLTRHSNFIEPDTIAACLQMLEAKRQELNQEIDELLRSVQEIDQEILDLNNRVVQPADKTGVPLSALHLLVCPHCGRRLKVDNAAILDDSIWSGTLYCANEDCPKGYRAAIEHGIVKTGNLYTGDHDWPDLKRGLYRNMVPEFSTGMQKSYDYIAEETRKMDLHGKVVLESNINGNFYLYQHLELLPEDCILVVTDRFPEMLEMYKNLIEQMGWKRDILFIADNSINFPLKRECVDLHISCLGENEYNLYHPRPFAEDAKKYFKPNVRILGVYVSFDKGAVSCKNLKVKYPECCEYPYQMDHLRRNYAADGFRLEAAEAGSLTDSGGRQFSCACHVKGETMRIFHFTASQTKKTQ